MENNHNMEFTPVVAKEKAFKVKEQKERFPGKAVISLNEVKEGESRMLTLSGEAFSALGLGPKDTRVGIARGYIDTAKTKEGIFLFKTDMESVLFVQDNKSAVKIETARFSIGTRRAMSVKYHNIISAVHSAPTDSKEKHFLLATRYGENYWLLSEYTPTEPTVITAPKAEVTSEVGEDVEVTID